MTQISCQSSGPYQIGFIGSRDQESLPSGYKIRAEIAAALGVEFFYIPVTKANASLLENKDELRVRYWNGNSLEERQVARPLACYDRSSPKSRSKSRAKILHLMSERGTSFVSDANVRKELADKWLQYLLLDEKGIPVPTTSLLDETALQKYLKHFSTVFIKPRVASQGKGQLVIQRGGTWYLLLKSGGQKKYRFRSFASLYEKVINFCRLPEQYIIQEGIDVDTIDKRVYDFRVVCQYSNKGQLKITGCYMRIGAPKSQQANIGQKGHPRDPSIVFEDWPALRKNIFKMARKIFRVFDYGIGEAGIDIVMTKAGELVCIEINTRPGSKGFLMMREWVTKDLHHQKKSVLQYDYTNRLRALWGERLAHFRSRPIIYCMHLINQKQEKV